jgi:hypothetical protein
MNKKADLTGRLQKTRKTWAVLLHFAAFVTSLIGGFLLPIEGSPETRKFAPVLVAAITGIVFSAVQRSDTKKRAAKWRIIAVTTLLLSIGAFLSYQYFKRDRTCTYDKQEVVIGTRYTKRASDYLKENPGMSCERLLADFTGKASDIWTSESINSSRSILEGMYLASVCLITMFLLAVGQAVYASAPKSAAR